VSSFLDPVYTGCFLLKQWHMFFQTMRTKPRQESDEKRSDLDTDESHGPLAAAIVPRKEWSFIDKENVVQLRSVNDISTMYDERENSNKSR
jgi:hypothetical protein